MASQRNNPATAATATVALYKSVIKDVVENVREAFLDDGADEHVLAELKTLWENKVRASGTVDFEGSGSGGAATTSSVPREPAAPFTSGGAGAHMKKMSNMPGMQKTPTHQGVIQQTHGSLSQGAREANVTLSQLHGINSSNQQPQLIRMQQPGGGVIMLQPGVIPAGATLGGMQLVLPTQQAIPQQHMHQRQFVVTKQEAHHQHNDLQQTDGPGGLRKPYPSYIEERDRERQMTRSQPAMPSSSSSGFISTIPESDSDIEVLESRETKDLLRKLVPQLDGAGGVSDDEDSNLGDDDLQEVGDEVPEPVVEDQGPEEVDDGEPLNSDDDIQNSDEETDAMFEADSVVICQYDKVQRNKNKWKFILKDGVMNLNGKDLVFNKATGEAEW